MASLDRQSDAISAAIDFLHHGWSPGPPPAAAAAPATPTAAAKRKYGHRNLRDVSRGELKFPNLRVLAPEHCLEVFPCPR